MCAENKREIESDGYKTEKHPVWCPGCGDFGVLDALHEALENLNIPSKDLVIVSGIGCSGRMPGFVKSYGFHGLHGRVLPVCLGVKLANPSLEVVGVSGDGDGFAIGSGHISHAARRNSNMAYLILDNSVYGLTKGQHSPTSSIGFESNSSPYGNAEKPLNSIAMLIGCGVSFIARGYSGRPKELAQIISAAISHKGFACVDIISPCTTFHNTYKIIQPKVSEIPAGHDPGSRASAFEMAFREDAIYLGVYYRSVEPTFEEKMANISRQAMASDQQKLDEIAAEFA